MPPRKSATLTEAELRLMDILWQKGPATVQQVVDGLPQGQPLAYNSVLTTLRILEKKAYVQHVKDGRAHVYKPLVARRDASRFEIRHLVSRFFEDSHEELVLNIIADQSIDQAQLQRLRQLLEAGRENPQPKDKAGSENSASRGVRR